jgi:uncharacterized protein YqcC (DUF446 family)
MRYSGQIAEKIDEITTEMKCMGLWKKQAPVWVQEYQRHDILTQHDFADWLQFVYLPNLFQWENQGAGNGKNYIVPQAMRFFSADVKRGRLLQLLIELDSLI